MIHIDQELTEIDQRLERSIVAVETQYSIISIDLFSFCSHLDFFRFSPIFKNSIQMFKTIPLTQTRNRRLISLIRTRHSSYSFCRKHRLFQALTFSEENYQ